MSFTTTDHPRCALVAINATQAQKNVSPPGPIWIVARDDFAALMPDFAHAAQTVGLTVPFSILHGERAFTFLPDGSGGFTFHRADDAAERDRLIAAWKEARTNG